MSNASDDGRIVQEALAASFAHIAQHLPGGEVVRSGPVVAALTGLPKAGLNPAHVLGDDGHLDHHIALVADRAADRGHPVGVVVRDEVPFRNQVVSVSRAAGLRGPASTSPGMLLRIPAAIPDPPEGLAVDRPHGEHLRPGLRVLAEAFVEPMRVVETLLEPSLFEDGTMRWVTLRGGRNTIAVGTVHVIGDVAGIFNIGVTRRRRKKGVGSAVTWESIRAGHELGATTAVLSSSPLGRGVYLRMGFAEVTTLRSLASA